MSNPYDVTIVLGEEVTQKDLDRLMSNYFWVKDTTKAFCDGELSLSDFEETLYECGIEPEEYSRQVEENAFILAR